MPKYSGLPYCDLPKSTVVNRIEDMLNHKDSSVLLVKGVSGDRIIYTTLPIESNYGFGDIDVNNVAKLRQWFPECDKDFIESNALPELKLGNIIDDWHYRRGKTTPAFRTISSLLKKFSHIESLEGCSFIATKNYRYGVVLGEAKEGDLVFVAYGSSYPLVLRQEDLKKGSHRLVGIAIIDELMDGEVFEMVEVGEMDEQTVLLR
jgi:hypothetical protein